MSSGNVSWLLNIFLCLHGKYLMNFIFWLFRIHIKCAFVVFQFVSFLYNCLLDNLFLLLHIIFKMTHTGQLNSRTNEDTSTWWRRTWAPTPWWRWWWWWWGWRRRKLVRWILLLWLSCFSRVLKRQRERGRLPGQQEKIKKKDLESINFLCTSILICPVLKFFGWTDSY